MPPITVYADTPLHPDGATPKTAAPEAGQDQRQPSPTPTQTASYDPHAPPPPQPGARPQPPTTAAPTSLYTSPPAPQPGAFPTVTATHTTTQTTHMPFPPQFSDPFPATNYAPTHSTQPDRTKSFSHASQYLPVDGGDNYGHKRNHSIEHPPGYQQNPYAADGTAEDRARFARAQEEAKEQEGVMGSVRQWVGRASIVAKDLEDGAWKYFNEK